MGNDAPNVSRRSYFGLNAANFFLAEIAGVVLPFLGYYLEERDWSRNAIGVAIAIAALGVFLMQTPAGLIVNRLRRRRALLAAASLLLGLCHGLVPLATGSPAGLDALLFAGGLAEAFFIPLPRSLTLELVGASALAKTMGANQLWNHAGNLATALLAMACVHWLGLTSVFYAVTVVSLLTAASVFLIRKDEVNHHRAGGGDADEGGKNVGVRELFRDRRVQVLIGSTALFHLANAPVMPFLGAYIRHVHGGNMPVATMVLISQAVMIPVSPVAAWLCNRWGRKWVFAIGMLVLPVRILLCALTQNPWELAALQALDGLDAGIYGVVIVAICADLTRGGGFSALAGIIATALAAGGVVGPLIAGALAQSLGYQGFLFVFSGVAAVAAAVFLIFMPETGGHEPAAEENRS